MKIKEDSDINVTKLAKYNFFFMILNHNQIHFNSWKFSKFTNALQSDHKKYDETIFL